MALGKFVSSSAVSDLIRKGVVNKEGVRILDCSFVPGVKPDWKQFREQLYGNFAKLSHLRSRGRELYLSGHVPEAVHADLEVAMYPGQYERFSQYPPEMFQEYVQGLGICRDEQLILYGRGPYGGMMFPARVAWLLKSYGHEKVSLLDGGWGDWLKRGFDVSQEVPELPRGNWVCGDRFEETLITFEQLKSVNGKYEAPPKAKIDPSDEAAEQKEKAMQWSEEMRQWEERNKGKMVIDQTDKHNFLDARPRAQFEGLQDSGLNQLLVDAAHIPGFRNTPVGEMITEEGTIRDGAHIKQWLESNGFDGSRPTVTICNTGMQASLLAYGIEYAVPDTKPLLYNGSLKEMEQRDGKRISGGHRHIPL